MFRKSFAFLAMAALTLACNNSKPAETTETTEATPLEIYGDSTITPENAVEAQELLALMAGHDSLEIKVKAEIEECCQKKGCWMDVKLDNGKSMTVRFKDYGFFVPMNAAGRTAIMEGIAKVDTQTVEWLRHKAEDAGASEEEIAAITEPQVSLSFLAKGVILE